MAQLDFNMVRTHAYDQCLATVTAPSFAYRRPDGVAVIPAALLGA